MKAIYFFILLLTCSAAGHAQTCTMSGTGIINWSNASPPACSEGGNANSKAVLVVPAGVTLVFDSNGDTWAGTRIDVYGTLNVTFDVTINSSISIYNGGLMNLNAKLSLGSGGGCPYRLILYVGGKVDVGGTGSDRLSICNVELMKGSGACNSCMGTNLGSCAYNGKPYCEPVTGFTGPVNYSESGYNGPLPVKLLYFMPAIEDTEVLLTWATIMEKGFEKFVIERSSAGTNFHEIGEVLGMGRTIYDVESKYTFVDKTPLLGFNYYRLKAIDLDGYAEYSEVRVVKLTLTQQVSVYPNPASGKSISFDINFNPADNDEVSLTNHLGVELLRQAVKDFQNKLVFDHELNPGVYFLKYRLHNFEKTIRLMVGR